MSDLEALVREWAEADTALRPPPPPDLHDADCMLLERRHRNHERDDVNCTCNCTCPIKGAAYQRQRAYHEECVKVTRRWTQAEDALRAAVGFPPKWNRP